VRLASSARACGLAALLLFAAVSQASGAGSDWASIGAASYEPPKPAPAFTLPDLAGKAVTLADQRGKVTRVFFWATW
jgi:cytochrome oxidase Cu insertion factor (SCO1/SenC/PrrC family)